MEEGALEAAGGDAGSAAKDLGSKGEVDPLSGLGIRNPVCDRVNEIRDRSTRISCETSGTPESLYPSNNYGFDIHISTGVTHPIGNITFGMAKAAGIAWGGLTSILSLTLSLLGMAFALNPFGDAETMRQVTGALGRMYARITDPWLTTLIVCGGIWFAFKSLVKRDVGAGVAGTLGAIAMLVVGLWIVHEPRQSVGRLAKISDQVALGVISAPQTGSVNRPLGSYAEAMSGAWSRLVEVPFAGLNFSDVRWALSRPSTEAVEKADEKFCDDNGALALLAILADLGSDDAKAACAAFAHKRYGEPRRVIDLYLRSSPGSPSRDALWDLYDNNDETKPKVAAQGGDGAFGRLSMLLLFAIGMLGAILLLLWLAIRLFTQAAIAFVLLLIAPFALFFPMLGDTGRRAFKTWGLALLGAIVAKVVYAMFLSVVLLGIAILGKVNGPAGSATGFLLSCAFAWAVFLKRAEVVGWMSIGNHESGAGHGLGLGHYHAMQWGERVAGAPFRMARGLGRRGRALHRVRRAERQKAKRGSAAPLREAALGLAEDRYAAAQSTVRRYETGAQMRDRGARKGKDGGSAGAARAGASGSRGAGAGAGPASGERGGKAGAKGAASAAGSPAGAGSRGAAGAGTGGEWSSEGPSEEDYWRAKRLLMTADRNEKTWGERWRPQDLDRFEKEDRRLLRTSSNPADHAHRVEGLGRENFERLDGVSRKKAERRIEEARKEDMQRVSSSAELPGRVYGRTQQKAEATREWVRWQGEKRARRKDLRQERERHGAGRRRRPERSGLSRGG